MVNSINGLSEEINGEQVKRGMEGKETNGASGILDDKYQDFLETGNLDELREKYQFIRGFIYGAHGTNHMAKTELYAILDRLSDEYRRRVHEILFPEDKAEG